MIARFRMMVCPVYLGDLIDGIGSLVLECGGGGYRVVTEKCVLL